METLTFRDPAVENYAEYPEPPLAPAQSRLTSNIAGRDKYLQALENYIRDLGQYIIRIQDAEAEAMANFTRRLKDIQSQKRNRKTEESEEDARIQYTDRLDRLRKQRKIFRSMKLDATLERQKLLDSMALQKEDEELLRQKLYRLRALPDVEAAPKSRRAFLDPFSILLVLLQIAFTLIFGFCTTFPSYNYPNPTNLIRTGNPYFKATRMPIFQLGIPVLNQGFVGYTLRVDDWFTFYSHMALMVFLGFGLLGSFFRRYAFSSLTYAFFIGAFALQWTILNDGFWWNVQTHSSDWHDINLTIDVLIDALYGCTAVIVTLLVLLGKVGPTQILIIVFFEVIFYSLNKWICLSVFSAVDNGGAMTVFMFGAFFGLAASIFLSRNYGTYYRRNNALIPEELTSSYYSDIFALLGTLLLWVLFPSFNAALARNGTQYRVVINTVLSLCASTICAFLLSRVFHRRLFHIRDIQYATIAGGVAIASAHAEVIQPGAALLVGSVAGIVVVIGLTITQPWLERRSPLRIYDSVGAQNTFGLGGIIGGLGGIVAASTSGNYVYGQIRGAYYPHGGIRHVQGGYQAAAFGTTLGIAILAGLFIGLILWVVQRFTRRRDSNNSYLWYSDEQEFIVPADFDRGVVVVSNKPNVVNSTV